MNSSIYNTPRADFDQPEHSGEGKVSAIPITAAERLAESRKQMQEQTSRSRLTLVWGLRALAAIIAIAWTLFVFFQSFTISIPVKLDLVGDDISKHFAYSY